MSEPLLVRALRREQVERTPVWFMRQAGRSLPEYRALREQHSFFEIAETPELCAEVTLQPVRRHGVDAAVLFADIMTPVLGMGIGVELVEGVGPVVESPVASTADVERLRVPDVSAFEPVLEAVRIVRRELEPERALVGFCGGPFTVAGYLVEGRPSRDFVRVKELMYRDPATWHALLDRLTDTFCVYVAAKAEAGADAIQLFDSWVGALSVADYDEFVAPYSARILAAVGVPTIHFGTGTSHLLGSMAAAGGDCIGLDWRIPLDEGWLAVGPDRAVQGNLDPAVLLGPWPRIESAALDVLARAAGRAGAGSAAGKAGDARSEDRDAFGAGAGSAAGKAGDARPEDRDAFGVGAGSAAGKAGDARPEDRDAFGAPGHVFNLGHGVLPGTDPSDLRRLVELVHERTATSRV